MLSPFADDQSLLRIVRAAQRAPSVHNSQPWSFWIRADDRLELRARADGSGGDDAGRWLTASDPSARELVISCGAALFNLRMAIRVTGHEVAAWLLPDPDGDPALLASVEVATGRLRPPTAREQDYYGAIWHRHTYRWPMKGPRVHANIITEMILAAAQEGAMLRALFPFQVNRWLHANGRAESELRRVPLYMAEIRRWTSGSSPGLGVPRAAFGPRPAGIDPPIRDFGLNGQDERPVQAFEPHPQLLSLATEGNQPLHWLWAGQALQRALLTATRYGVVASFLTQWLELADHRHEPPHWPVPWTFHEYPQMLIRVGYPARTGIRTPREQSPEVLDLRASSPRA